MTIKQIALGACLLVSGSALAQDKTYTVREGDTLSEIANKFGVNTKAILHANNLTSADKLKLGQTLSIPAKVATPRPTKSSSGYSVQPGDNDESIAKKLHITSKELRLANMGTKWTKLQIGQVINIPGSKGWYETLSARALTTTNAVAVQSEAPVQLASSVTPSKPKVVQKTYQVHGGDNDWIIAKKLGLKPSELRTLNPSVKWTNLKIGTLLKVPGTQLKSSSAVVLANKAEKEPNLPRIRSRYAVVTGDSVTLRRGPSVRFDVVTRVDQGTRVLVLDREGAWYKARFPMGTEAWVRGDFLAPTKAPMVASNEGRSTKKNGRKETIVAARTKRSSRDSRGGNSTVARRPKSYGPAVIASGNGDSVMEKADSYLGVRYRYGAMSRSATDCSGFVGQVYRGVGVKLPRTAREMSGKGQKVDRNGMKPGDLVFFNTRGSRVSHVGIYKGDGKFIHASSGGGKVMVSSLNEGYYNRRFAGARRVMNAHPAKKQESKLVKKDEPKSEPSEPVTTPVEPPSQTGGN